MSIFRQTDPAEATAPIVGFASNYEPGTLASHLHPHQAQLMYAVQGMMHVTTPVGRWILPAGRALWIAAGTEHGLEVRRPLSLSILYFREGAPGLPRWPGCAVVNVSPLLRELIGAAVLAGWNYPPGSAEDRLMHVLIDQLAVMGQAPVDLPEPRDARAVRVADLAREDAADRRPLAILAPLAGASPRTIERLFASETGMSFGAWRHRHRLIVALERLAGGESVVSAAFSVGYDNASSFIAAFRAMFGRTPGRYFAND